MQSAVTCVVVLAYELRGNLGIALVHVHSLWLATAVWALLKAGTRK